MAQTRAARSPAPPPLRVLGIDPGTRRMGWGVVERAGARMRAVAAGVIAMDAKAPLHERLLVAFDQLEALIEDHAPQVVAVEDIFYARFPSAAIKLGHVRGVVLVVAARASLIVSEYPPALVKRTVAGRGAADKAQLARIVASALSLRKAPPSDAADALAVAMTHLSASRVSVK